MAKDLVVKTKAKDENCIEFFVGESNDALERVGILREYYYNMEHRYNGGRYYSTEYTALPSRKIDSFHMRDEGKFKKIHPNTSVELRVGDRIAFGPGYPLRYIEREMPCDNDPRSKN